MSRRTTQPAWVLLGLAGSVIIVLSGSELLDGRPVHWWTGTHLFSATAQKVVLLAGLALLCAAWLGLGHGWEVTGPPSVRRLSLISVLWGLPLALGPALFSSDAYSYLAQGLIVHLGLDPYRTSPAALATLGHPHVLAAVSPFWRHTTTPYGPGFLGIAAVAAALAGPHLELAVLLLRLPELAGLGLIAWFAPRLARRSAADPARAVWLAVLSPLVLVELIDAGHNDALMAGLLLAAVTLAVEGRTLWAVALCALAAAVKLPAAAAIPLIAATQMRTRPQDALKLLTATAVITGGVLAAVTLAAGLGPDWVSRGVLSTPGLVRLSLTPVTDAGWVLAHLARALGLAVDERSLERGAGKWALILPACLGLWLLVRVRAENLVRSAGALLVALVVFGPASWPWYLVWGLTLLACLPQWQSRRLARVLVTIPVFLIYADGRVRLPLSAAPWMLGLYALAAVIVLGPVPWRLPARSARARAAVAGRP